MNEKAFQEHYPEDVSHCYGCGTLNDHGLHIKSYWDGEESICHFKPHDYHTAVPGFVYGGLLASLIDCHSTATASAAAYKAAKRPMGSTPILRFVTASLHVDYKRPVPINSQIELRGKITELKERKVVISTDLYVDGNVCAIGTVVAVLMPENMKAKN
jgi:acyl-coenzyme A thioesterase PaaI-like protein